MFTRELLLKRSRAFKRRRDQLHFDSLRFVPLALTKPTGFPEKPPTPKPQEEEQAKASPGEEGGDGAGAEGGRGEGQGGGGGDRVRDGGAGDLRPQLHLLQEDLRGFQGDRRASTVGVSY